MVCLDFPPSGIYMTNNQLSKLIRELMSKTQDWSTRNLIRMAFKAGVTQGRRQATAYHNSNL